MCDASPVPPANCKTDPVVEQVNKDETRLANSFSCLRFRTTVTFCNGVRDAAMLEEHLCAMAGLSSDKTFSQCLFCVLLAGV